MVKNVRGHVGESQRLAKEDIRQRREAEGQSNTLLSKKDLQGEWDASRVLHTTLNGQLRQLNKHDLDAFRKNMQTAQREFKGGGITPRQVLDHAASKPLKYRNPLKENAISDLDKAKRQIRNAIIASARGNQLRIVTSSSEKSKVNQHYVTVRLNAMDDAIRQLATVPAGDDRAIRKIARWLVKQKVAFDCDCERHRYFFRYVATIGGYNAGRPETAYPKITNPGLKGVACMHVIRAMNELDSSGVALGFIERLLRKIHASENNRGTLKITEAEAKKQIKARKRAIKTSDDRKAEARRRRELESRKRALRDTPRLSGRQPAATRKYKKALESGQLTTDDLIALLVKNNINPEG